MCGTLDSSEEAFQDRGQEAASADGSHRSSSGRRQDGDSSADEAAP